MTMKKWFSAILLLLFVISTVMPTCFASEEADAMLEEGWRYYQGDGVEQNQPRGIAMMLKAAEDGSKNAMLRLGYLCAYGQGVNVSKEYKEGSDAELAFEWFNKIAEAGDPEMAGAAFISVGYNYLLGNDESIPEDTAQAVHCFEKAEELGVYDANDVLAVFYTYGAIVDKDPDKALSLLMEGARAGVSICEQAIEEYAYSYFAGTDEMLDINFETAFKYYEALTEFDNPRAMYNIGMLYAYGLGTAKDTEKGIEWVQNAADAGLDMAKEALPGLKA